MTRQEGRTLRILLATPYKMGGGGISQWAENIMRHYQSLSSPQVTVDILPMGRSASTNPTSMLGRVWSGVADYSGIIREERRMLRQGKYDVLHLCTSASISLLKDLVMLGVARRHHVRTVVHFHFGRIPEVRDAGNWEWRLLRRVIDKADMAVPIDQMSLDALTPSWPGKVRYLPNPVAQVVDDFVRANANGQQRDERMVFFAGHCIKTKGMCELVSACRQLKGIRLVLAGHIDEDMRRELLGMAGNEPWLEIRGEMPHEEILRLMMQCGVYVLPSYTEGFPNVMLESMACGCAIVATTVGAIPEMIGEENGRHYGLLVPPRDTEKLREAISMLLDDNDLRESCRRNALERVNERYNIGSVWSKLVQIWQHAAGDSQ